MNHFLVTGLIRIADKLDGNFAAIPRFQRQVVITDIPILLEPPQHGMIGRKVLEWTEFADGLADHFVAGKPQQRDQEWIHVGDAARVKVQNQNAILRRFEQPAIIKFGDTERLLGSPAIAGHLPILMIDHHNPQLHQQEVLA